MQGWIAGPWDQDLSLNQESYAQLNEPPRCPAISTCMDYPENKVTGPLAMDRSLPENWPLLLSSPLQEFYQKIFVEKSQLKWEQVPLKPPLQPLHQ